MRAKLLAAGIILAVTSPAFANCPPMSAYNVSGLSIQNGGLDEVMSMMFTGTAWRVNATEEVKSVRLNLRGVSGPLDKVYRRVVDAATGLSSQAIVSIADVAGCEVSISVRVPVAPTPRVIEDGGVDTPEAIVADYQPHTLPAGSRLSEALNSYVATHEWQLRWLIEEDYVLDVDVPIPPMDLVDGVTFVVNAYQAQGGMRGVVPRFARGNRVVVIESMDVRAPATASVEPGL